MTTLAISSLILMAELALASWVMLFLMLRRQRKLKHQDHHHADAVIEHLETSEVSRRDALATLFETTYRLDGDALAAKVDEYVEREKAFYKAMLSLYLSRDGAKLKQLPEELAKVLSPWAEMTPTGMIHASEVSSLETEKATISAELESTKHTLEQLMDEYMAAFKEKDLKAQPAPPAPSPPAGPDVPALDAAPAEEPDAQTPDPSDFDVASEDSELVEAEEIPEPDLTPEPEEEPIDQAALDAMLSAFESETDDAQPQDGAAQDPPAGDAAQQELDGLADLFEEPDDKA